MQQAASLTLAAGAASNSLETAVNEAFEKLLAHRNHVGLLSEDLHHESFEQLGNFPQTYSHVGIINAAFVLNPFGIEVGDA